MAKSIHKEDIKAELRKLHGTLLRFETKAGRPRGSVKDVLRGRASAETEAAIAAALKQPLHVLFPVRYRAPAEGESSTKVDNTPNQAPTHRLSAGAR